MKKKWQIKIISILFLAVTLTITIVIAPFAYNYLKYLSPYFWNNVIGNIFATVFALIAGIPIALWIDRRIKSREGNKKHLGERKREKEILQLIREELDYSYSSLFLNSKKGIVNKMVIQPLKSDLWEALLLSGETRYIENPKLLNRITSAYYILKLVKNIEEQAYTALRTSALVFKEKDGTESNSAQKLLKDARDFDNLFEKSMKEALRMIDERLLTIQTNEN